MYNFDKDKQDRFKIFSWNSEELSKKIDNLAKNNSIVEVQFMTKIAGSEFHYFWVLYRKKNMQNLP